MTNTPVIFRKDPDGVVFALFPDDPADVNGLYVTCYQHVGQHSSADYNACVAASKPALPVEYQDLLNELESIGYENLRVYKRQTVQHRNECRRKMSFGQLSA